MASRNPFPKGTLVYFDHSVFSGVIGKVVSARGRYVQVEFEGDDLIPLVRTVHFDKSFVSSNLRRIDSVTPGNSLPKVRKEKAVQDADGGNNSGSQDDVKPRIRASKKRGATKVVQV